MNNFNKSFWSKAIIAFLGQANLKKKLNTSSTVYMYVKKTLPNDASMAKPGTGKNIWTHLGQN